MSLAEYPTLPNHGRLTITKRVIKMANPEDSHRCAIYFALVLIWGCTHVEVYPRHRVTGEQLDVIRFTYGGHRYVFSEVNDAMVFATIYDNLKTQTPARSVNFNNAKLIKCTPAVANSPGSYVPVGERDPDAPVRPRDNNHRVRDHSRDLSALGAMAQARLR